MDKFKFSLLDLIGAAICALLAFWYIVTNWL